MIQMRSWVDVADNTGAKLCCMIKVLGRGNSRFAEVGDIIVASVKKALPSSEIKAGAVVRGVVPDNSVVAGIPAKVVRRHTDAGGWDPPLTRVIDTPDGWFA